jgi:hypothetical protein
MYEAHKWKIGEEITSDKLNHIEKGIEAAGMPIEITDPQDGQTLKYDAASGKWVNGEGGSTSPLVVSIAEQTMDKTVREIYDAFPNVILTHGSVKGTILSVQIDSDMGIYTVYANDGNAQFDAYVAETENGYPVYTIG